MKLAQQQSTAIKFDTTRFGPVTVDEEKVITFSRGLPGFERLRRFILIDHDKDGLFRWLQAVDDPTTAFLLTDPALHIPGFRIHVRKSDLKGLEAGGVNDLLVLVTVSVSQGTVTLNLRAPVVFNSANMRALQCILEGDDAPADYVIKP